MENNHTSYDYEKDFIDIPVKKKSFWPKVGKLCRDMLFVCLISIISIQGYIAFAPDTADANQANTNPNQTSTLVQQTATTPNSGQELTSQQIGVKVTPSVVAVVSQERFGQSTGSGIIMTADGMIMTNAHVIEDAQSITVVLHDGAEYPATLIGQDAQTDLAVVKIQAKDLTPAEFGDSDELEVGERAIAIGNPLGLEFSGSMTQGIISALGREVEVNGRTMTFIQTDAAINPGNSGGPLVNAYGQVIGITSAKISTQYAEGLGFAIPINDALPIIEELVNYGYVTGRPLIGITGQDLTAKEAAYYQLPQGIYVRFVDPDSGASLAGIEAGDIITAANGKEITTTKELNEIKDALQVGDTITLSVYRNGKTESLKVVLSESKS